MRYFEAASQIAADPTAVWSVLADGKGWASWDSGVDGVDGADRARPDHHDPLQGRDRVARSRSR